MPENHYAILVSNLKISYVFKYQINITLLLLTVYLGKSYPNPNTKVQKICDTAFHYHGFYYDSQFNITILYSFRHSQYLHKLVFLASKSTDVWNTIYVEAKIALLILFKWTYRPVCRVQPVGNRFVHAVTSNGKHHIAWTMYYWAFSTH